MSNDAGTGRQAYWGERLAQAIQWVRRGGVTSHADCELLVEEIDRLRSENGRLRCDLQKLDEELLNATRHQAPHDCEQWLEDARICRRCSALFRGRELLQRELEQVRAARNVALDKLVQIARIVSPDDFEEVDA